MYLHLGQDVVVRLKSIIGIFDLENASYSRITRQFLENAEKSGRVVSIGDDLPKSFAVCQEDGKTIVYVSQISATTLLRRCEGAFDFGEQDTSQ